MTETTPTPKPRVMAPVDEQIETLMSGVEYGDATLKRQMERELRALLELDRPLRVYLGIDPTATSLTLGHTVPLRKLRQFQAFGHHAIFLIGDYTALIGDPSDKNKLRPMLTQEDIKANEATYFEQAARLLDASKTELRHNSEWLGALTFPQIISLMSKFTVQEMLNRHNFRRRWGGIRIQLRREEGPLITLPVTENQIQKTGETHSTVGFSVVTPGTMKPPVYRTEPSEPIYLHEFLYALMQGYDAYALECDVQVGGTEQLFNLMAGRKIQEDAGQRPHVPVTLPILVGLDGKERMSKSKGNHIGVNDPPGEQYGKAMSLPDNVLMDFFVLATNVARGELQEVEREIERDPMGAKKRLARTIVGEFWGESAAREAEEGFERTVQRKEMPGDVPEFAVTGEQLLVDVLSEAGMAPSRREARRLLGQGAVSVDGAAAGVDARVSAGVTLQVGKRRWLRLV